MINEKYSDWIVENWIEDAELKELEYSNYWNNDINDAESEWNVLDGDFEKMERYLHKTKLCLDLKKCLIFIKNELKLKISGIGADLAAGNLWTTKYLFDSSNIEKLYCIEYSKHRLFKIGPVVLKHYNIRKENVVLVLGNFYKLQLGSNSLDFIIMSQAFHHADKPEKLLEEIHRVLKPGGVVIIIGEKSINYFLIYLYHSVKTVISCVMPRKLQISVFGKTFKREDYIFKKPKINLADSLRGDHVYSLKHYKKMFSKYNFSIKYFRNFVTRMWSFILVKPEF